MITQFWKYRGLKFYPAGSDTMICKTIDNSGVNIVLQNQIKESALRTATFQNQNSHGSYTSKTLGGGRLFTFTGKIFGTREQKQTAMDYLNSQMQPEGLFIGTEGFYTLTWEDLIGREFKTEAKVYGGVKYSNDINSPIIDFTFELYSNEFEYLSTTQKVGTGGIGRIGGTTLGTTLGVTLSGIQSSFNVVNEGNFEAGCKIRIQGSLENPKMTNFTNGTKYELEGITTTDLIVDNRGTDLIVEDNGVNVEQYGNAGSTIMLSKGSNQIFVTGDNYVPGSSVELEVTFNDTFSNN